MNNLLKRVSTKELFNSLNDPNTIIVDTRPSEAYNGWKLEGEERGGHIKGAKSLPFRWTDYIDWLDIVRSKDIMPDNSLILYGYNPEKTAKVAGFFIYAGHKDVKVYDDFIKEWSSDHTLPMDRLHNYRHLIYPDWLRQLITTKNPPNHNGSNYVICHVHYRNIYDYRQGHIPGAIELDTLKLESPETWNRRSPEELNYTLTQMGITQDTTVILYGRFSYPNNGDLFPGSHAGHLGAIRCALIMMYAGVKNVLILNGGVQSWEDAGYELTTKETKPVPVDDFNIKIPARPELIVDIDEAKAILRSPNKNLISVRSWSEYIGEESGYNYINKRGRIPYSIFSNCGSDAYHMENYRNLDHTTREYHEIENNWKRSGITPDKHNSFYCGTGWRASEAFFNAWLMGWSNISIYDGGWFEWSNDHKNPYELGIPNELTIKIN